MLPANLEKLSNDQLSKYMQYENVLLFKEGERAWANHQSFPTLITIVSIQDYFSHDENDENDENTLRLWRCCRSRCCSSTPPSTPRSPATNVIVMSNQIVIVVIVLNTYHNPPVADTSDSSFGNGGAPKSAKLYYLTPLDIIQKYKKILKSMKWADDQATAHLLITCLHRPSPDQFVPLLSWSYLKISTIGYI